MKNSHNGGYAPTKLLEYAVNNGYINSSKGNSEITLSNKDGSIDFAKNAFLNLGAKTKAECHLKWLFSLNEEEREKFSQTCQKGQGIALTSDQMSEVIENVYLDLDENKAKNFAQKFKYLDEYGIALDRSALVASFGEFILNNKNKIDVNTVCEDFKIGYKENDNSVFEVLAKNFSNFSYQLPKEIGENLFKFLVGLTSLSVAAAESLKGCDPNLPCPTNSPTSPPTSFIATNPPTLAPSEIATNFPTNFTQNITSLFPSPSPNLTLYPTPIPLNITALDHDQSGLDDWVIPVVATGAILACCCGCIYFCQPSREPNKPKFSQVVGDSEEQINRL